MGLTLLKLDRACAKWWVKLKRAFEKARGKLHIRVSPLIWLHFGRTLTRPRCIVGNKEDYASSSVFFSLSLVTTLHEGAEAVVFVRGVYLGHFATSIPFAAIVGLICGLNIGLFIYAFASCSAVSTFLVVMTNVILLIGADFFSKAIGDFQRKLYNHLFGKNMDDTGDLGVLVSAKTACAAVAPISWCFGE